MTKDEALKLALKALVTLSEQSDCDIDSFTFGRFGGNTAITAIKEVLAQPAPPPECKTEAEQTAYAFGWWKALESVRTEQPAQEPLTGAPTYTEQQIANACWAAEISDIKFQSLLIALQDSAHGTREKNFD
jgi:hypothetical protein